MPGALDDSERSLKNLLVAAFVLGIGLRVCSEAYPAGDVDCHPTGETLRGTPVYWCSISFDDYRRSSGACVNLAGSDLAMSGPVAQEECNAFVAKARTNGFFTEADEVLP
jgi:hypothetical protein